jgi:chromosome segregation ATPase
VRLSVLRTLPEDRVVTAIGALKSLLESNVRSMDDCAQTLANSATKLAESVGALERKVGESATRLGSAAGKLEHLGKDVDASLGRVAQTIGDRLAEANHDFKKVAEDQAGALKTQLTEIAGAITIAIASQNSSAEKLSKDIESALGKIGKALSGSLGHMETALGANLSAMNNEIAGAMRSQKEATKENDEKLREFLGTLRKTVEVLNENTKEALAQLNGYQAKSTGALEGLDTQLNLFAQQQAKLLDLIGRWEAMTGKAALEAARPRGEVIGAAAPPAEASTSPKRGPRGSGGAGPNDGFV